MTPAVLRNTRLARTVLAASLAAIGACAQAQTAPAVQNMESITVIGQAASIDRALEQQRSSDSIENVVHTDGINQLPDDNAAEALQRLPGISVERDQGEGRFVIVRGIGPDLNSVTINGTLIPAPESDRRAVALDVLPSELVQSLSVVKSLTPDMDANSLGGTIEVESLSAFDHEEDFNTLSVEGSYDDNSRKASPKGSGAFTRRFSVGGGENNLGVAAAFSWQQRDFGSDNVETGGAWDTSGGNRLEEMEQRDYRIRRERTGLGLNFDFRPDASSEYYLRTLYSRYSDKETRNSALAAFEDPLAAGEVGAAEGERALKFRTDTQKIASVVLGGERRFNLWTVSAQGGYSRAEERNPGGIAGATFVGNDAFEGASFRNGREPRLDIDDRYYDAAAYTLDEIEYDRQKTTDTEKNLRLDLARDYDLAGIAANLKFGGKISRREKKNELDVWTYGDFGDFGFSDEQLSMAGFASGRVDYKLGRFGPGISSSAVGRVMRGLDRDGFFDEEASRVNDFRMQEDIDAAYVMNRLDLERWTLIGGLRYEGTRFEAQGTGVNDGEFESVSRKRRYDDWLPGLHARFHWSENTQVRAAWTNTVVRPTFGQLAPGFVIEDDEAEFGNPDLKPLKSMNFDLGLEHYFGRASMASAYVFYKDIDNFIYNTDLAGTGDWADFSQAETFANGRRAKLYGLELAYMQKMHWLPAPWNGLLAGANATFSRSRAEIQGQGMRRRIDLPNQSDVVGNLMVGWENESVSLRLSANYKSKYLAEVAAIDDPDHDLYADSQTFLDFSARYHVNKNLQVYFEAQNLTNESYYVYTGSRSRNAQYEEYGPTYKLGMTLLF